MSFFRRRLFGGGGFVSNNGPGSIPFPPPWCGREEPGRTLFDTLLRHTCFGKEFFEEMWMQFSATTPASYL